VGEIHLAENDKVVTVFPSVTVDPQGGFLVTDLKEAQVRQYRRDGSLTNYFGSRGQGPGEFDLPMRAHRLDSGEILVVDFTGTLDFFDRAGKPIGARSRPPLTILYDALPLREGKILLAGRDLADRDSATLLHIWNPESEEVEADFFPVPGNELIRRISEPYGLADATIRNDTIAAVFAFSDTLYLFDMQGLQLSRIPIPAKHFLPLTSPSPRVSDVTARNKWELTFTRISSVTWLADGSFLIQYFRANDSVYEWNLVHMNSTGGLLFELTKSPRLLAAKSDTLFFVHPLSLVPNEWLLAVLR